MTATSESIILCQCRHAGLLDRTRTETLHQALKAIKKTVTLVEDLCGMAAQRQNDLQALAVSGSVVIACRERALTWLLHRAGVKESDGITLIDILSHDLHAAAEKLQLPEMTSAATAEPGPCTPAWQPWYPVIDYDRCINCRQCASFCLFGVYSVDAEGRVNVTSPEGCKNLCPACARICPEAAIIFPKLDEAPYNGAAIEDEAALKQRIQSNVNQMLGDDIYTALAERRKKAKRRLLRTDALKQAEEERARCLKDSEKDNT